MLRVLAVGVGAFLGKEVRLEAGGLVGRRIAPAHVIREPKVVVLFLGFLGCVEH
jgi:hypothetical protein